MRSQSLSQNTPFLDPFDLFFRGVPRSTSETGARTPYFSAREEESRYVVEAEVPGIREEELSIQIKENELRVESIKHEDAAQVIHRLGDFRKVYQFEAKLNVEDASASLERGILSISLPKAASAVPRTLSLTPSK